MMTERSSSDERLRRRVVYTIGHSTHEIEAFVGLLARHEIEAIADVRSSPFSRYNGQFNRPALEASLKAAGIGYVFLGEELGARRGEAECYRDDRVDYERVAATAAFRRGLERLADGASRMRIATLCAEHDPLTCHRTILIARHLAPLVDDVRHVLRDGTIETQAEAEQRLLRECGLDVPDLFTPPEERLVDAYRRRAAEIAYALADEAADARAEEEAAGE
jgi:uncharacterized protein (DUF488 family)